jgi:Flp pilus assembly pilin Flp
MRQFRNFLRDENGQDLIEYTLILAFVCLASAGLFVSAGGSVSAIWGKANDWLPACPGGTAVYDSNGFMHCSGG